ELKGEMKWVAPSGATNQTHGENEAGDQTRCSGHNPTICQWDYCLCQRICSEYHAECGEVVAMLEDQLERKIAAGDQVGRKEPCYADGVEGESSIKYDGGSRDQDEENRPGQS